MKSAEQSVRALGIGLTFGVFLAACGAQAVSPVATTSPNAVETLPSVSVPIESTVPLRVKTTSPATRTPTATARPPTAFAPPPTPTRTETERNTMSEQLIAAAGEGDTVRVRELIHEGAPLDAQDGRGRTAVMAATYGNHAATVQVLTEAGADVNIRDAMLNNPFLYAGAEGYEEILRLAYAAGADPKITNRFGGTALIPACERGHVEVVRYLLTETKVDVNHVNNLGWTGLLEAIVLSDGGARHQEIVKLLIEHDADVNIADKEGVTPFAHAKRRGFREIQALLEAAGGK